MSCGTFFVLLTPPGNQFHFVACYLGSVAQFKHHKEYLIETGPQLQYVQH